jgi:hypothetical protein
MSETETEPTSEAAAPPPEPEIMSWAECEAAGWVLVHEGPWQNDYRAEKYPPGGSKVEQSAVSKEKLAEAISYWEATQETIAPQPPPEQEAIAEAAEAEGALKTVTGPDGELYTEDEWTARDSGYEPTAEAAAEGTAQKQEAADSAAAEPEVEVETLETVNRDNQPDEIMSVLPGEESMSDVIERKAEASAESESERGAVNQGIGPHGPDGPEGYMGGEPETYDPGPGLSETELAMQQEREQQNAELIAREREEAAAQVEAAEQASEAAPAAEGDLDATPAAVAKAEELGVDITTVEGTGKDGKITVGDVEDAAPAGE